MIEKEDNSVCRKIAIIRTYRGGEIDNNYYHLQEVGLAKALKKRNPNSKIEIWMLTYRAESFSEYEITEGIHVIQIPSLGIGHEGKLPNRLLMERNIDYVHLAADNNIFAPSTFSYCKKHKIPCHLYIGAIYSDKNGFTANVRNKITARWLAFRYKDALIYAKTSTVVNQCKQLGMKNVNLLPVGLDIDRIKCDANNKEQMRKKLGLITEDKSIIWILFVARLEEYKKPKLSIELLKNLPNQYRMIIIGSGSLKKEMEYLVKENGLETRVKMIERIPNDQVIEYCMASDYLVNFNPKEIYGMSILEAMSRGCVPAAIHAPGPDFIIRDGFNGILVNDIHEMAKRIKGMDQVSRGELSEKARETIITKFSWDGILDRYGSAFVEFV